MLRLLKQLFNKGKGPIRTVQGFKNPQVASKLLSVGILPGSQLQIIRRAPGSYVYYIKVDDVSIALRKNELEAIILDKKVIND
ncbi:MAG TPA: ferrous iron transporter A [Saprospiraceae bacterium]|nr:ferrous iron transporter A [Saprospiraceae bacterium]